MDKNSLASRFMRTREMVQIGLSGKIFSDKEVLELVAAVKKSN